MPLSPADAYAITGSLRCRLSEDCPQILPAGPIVLQLSGLASSDSIRLDGDPLPVAFDEGRGWATASIDLKRSTGFHQLRVVGRAVWLFGTQDAKLRIDGVIAMLAYLGERDDYDALRWSGTVQFSGRRTMLRDARLDVAWLERNGDEVERIAAAIIRKPFAQTRVALERARSGVPDVSATAALVRRRPDVLEKYAEGPVSVGAERWAPREIVRKRVDQTTDTQGNRAVTRLLVATRSLALYCGVADPPAATAAELGDRVDRLSRLLERHPFEAIRRARGHRRLSRLPAREQRLDQRYRRGRQLLLELQDNRHWDPSVKPAEQWAFAALADQVFQAFCAQVLARGLGLRPVASRGPAAPSFSSERYEMWVDSVPPAGVLSNWRDGTSNPAALRPDLMIRRKSDGAVALLDAKYRSAGSQATPDSLTDVQLYLQAFGARCAGVLFPPAKASGSSAVRRTTNGFFSLVELPLWPHESLDQWVSDVLLPEIHRLFHQPSPVTAAGVDASADEASAASAQRAAARTLVADGEVVRLTQPSAFVASENRLRRQLEAIWDLLEDPVRRMLITAEYFGDQVPDGFDHSGPVLGLFAACERLLQERLFKPSRTAVGSAYRRITFGEAAEVLRRLPTWRTGNEAELRRWVVGQPGADLDALALCGREMKKVNRWRIAAAHAELVDKATWDASDARVLDARNGLLVTLARALPT